MIKGTRNTIIGIVFLLFVVYGAFYAGLSLGKEVGNLNMKACFIDGLRQGIGASQAIYKERLSNFSFLQDNALYITYNGEEGLMINGKPASYYNITSRCIS